MEELKVSLFADAMIGYVKHPRDSTKLLIELSSPARSQDTRSTYKINYISIYKKWNIINQNLKFNILTPKRGYTYEHNKHIQDLYAVNLKKKKKLK